MGNNSESDSQNLPLKPLPLSLPLLPLPLPLCSGRMLAQYHLAFQVAQLRVQGDTLCHCLMICKILRTGCSTPRFSAASFLHFLSECVHLHIHIRTCKGV